MPILASADPRARREEGVVGPWAQPVFAVVWEVILTYESAPDSTPCPDHVERLRSTCPWSMAVDEQKADLWR
jgi:hypothetical protein